MLTAALAPPAGNYARSSCRRLALCILLRVHGFHAAPGRLVMSFGIYAVGYFILIIGIAYLAHLMHVPQAYIVAIAIIMFGIGIVTGVQATRGKDPS
jgi:hypothetical protein